MNQNYSEYMKAFQNLEIEDKHNEIIKNMRELIDFIENDDTGNFAESFDSKSYDSHDEFTDDLFAYLIYLKELIGNKY